MNPLIVVIAFHQGEIERVTNLLNWISELGGARPHSCLLVYDDKVTVEDRVRLGVLAKESFDFVGRIPATIKTAWAPNGMFLSAAKWVHECCKLPFLWLESDCTPLQAGWIDELADEYDLSPKKFMGPLIKSDQQGLPPMHLTGCSIYPNDAFLVYEPSKALREEIVAWDIDAAAAVVPRAKDTVLIHHFYGPRDLPPTFVESRKPDDPKNRVAVDFIRKGAVLFHRVKDGSLIALLRSRYKKAGASSTALTANQSSAPAP